MLGFGAGLGLVLGFGLGFRASGFGCCRLSSLFSPLLSSVWWPPYPTTRFVSSATGLLF